MAAHKRKVSDRQLDELWEAYQNGTITGGGDQINITVPGGTSIDPVGTIISFMGTKPPAEYLVCDGSEYNIQDYPQLAAHILTHFGSYNYFGGGDGTFCVPDLRGEFLRGTGTNNRIGVTPTGVPIPQGSGEEPGIHQDSTNIIISGTDSSQNATQPYYSMFDQTSLQADSMSEYYGQPNGRFVYNSNMLTWNDQRNSWYTIRPTNTSVLYCIKADCKIYKKTIIATSYCQADRTIFRIGNVCQLEHSFFQTRTTVPLGAKIFGFPDGFKPCARAYCNVFNESSGSTVRLVNMQSDGLYNYVNVTMGANRWFFCAPFTYITSDPYPEEETIEKGETDG